jgi:DNA-directed RNA polymerase specialized sigma24 family protein
MRLRQVAVGENGRINHSEDERWRLLDEKLDTLIRLLGMTIGVGLPTAERAPMLQRAGLDRSAIAAVCGASVEAVSVRLAEAKRKKVSKGRNSK